MGTEQAQEDQLQDILGILGASRNPPGSLEDHAAVPVIKTLKVRGLLLGEMNVPAVLTMVFSSFNVLTIFNVFGDLLLTTEKNNGKFGGLAGLRAAVQDSRFKIQDSRFKIQDSRLAVA